MFGQQTVRTVQGYLALHTQLLRPLHAMQLLAYSMLCNPSITSNVWGGSLSSTAEH
jgi:hypothetical protein